MVDRVVWVVAYWPKSSSVLFSGPADDDAIPTPNPVLSQRPSDCKELQHEPTIDYKPVSAVICEPAPSEENELKISAEPELHESDQVCELAAPSIAEELLVVYEDTEVSPTHPFAT